jgi:hypothetical protein
MTAAKKLQPENTVKRVLVYENRKCDPTYYDASTEELEAGAFLQLFKDLDEGWQVYAGIEDPHEVWTKRPEDHPDGCMCDQCKAFRSQSKKLPEQEKERLAQLELYKKAKKGDALSAKKLMTMRKDGEYEDFKIVRVQSFLSSYPPREWGVTRPCGEVFIAANGVYKWATHGRISTRELREKSYEYGYNGPGTKSALKRVVTGSVLHFDPKTETEVDLGDEVWSFRPRGKDKDGKPWSDGEWMYRGLCSDAEHAKTGIPILEQGSMKPGKVIRMTYQVCGGCKREIERFGDKD